MGGTQTKKLREKAHRASNTRQCKAIRQMRKKSQRVQDNATVVDAERIYSIKDGVEALKESESVKFDETVDIAVNLGIDPGKSDQAVRGAVSLPHGTGRSANVICFVKDPGKQQAAKDAGAREVGDDELVKKVQGGWTDFDVVIAAPDMMGQVGKLGKVLGPQGKMPSPKSGTVTPDVENAVREFVGGKVEFRADAGGTVHGPIGKRSFDDGDIAENVRFFISAITALKPSATRGEYIAGVFLSTTMGPSVAVDPAS